MKKFIKIKSYLKKIPRNMHLLIWSCLIIAIFIALFLCFRNFTSKENAENLVQRSAELFLEGDKDQAIRTLEQYYLLNKQNKDVDEQLASYYYQTKDYAKIMNIADDAKFDSEAIYNLAAFSALQLGKNEEAVALYEEGIAKFPLNTRMIINLATFYQNRSDYAKALEVLNKGLIVNKTSVLINLAKASILLKMGESSAARSSALEALKYDPENTQAKAILHSL